MFITIRNTYFLPHLVTYDNRRKQCDNNHAFGRFGVFLCAKCFKLKGFSTTPWGCCWFLYMPTAKLAKQINAKYSADDENRSARIVGCPHEELGVFTAGLGLWAVSFKLRCSSINKKNRKGHTCNILRRSDMNTAVSL